MIKDQRSKLELLDDYTNYNNKILEIYIRNITDKYITGEITMDEAHKMAENDIKENYKILRKEEVELDLNK